LVTYRIIKEQIENNDIGKYTSFGIAAYIEENGTDTLLKYIPDVFTDESEITELVNKCNNYALDPEHLFDVVCDSL